MAVCNPGWEKWLDRLYNLRRDKSGSHERPHKPALLLSIIDLLDHGVITRNEVPLSDELVATFKRYFAQLELEARVGIEPTDEAFAEPCLTTWLPRHREV